jgi:glycosyltransferase involved in cell wall biosynthesis
MLAYVAQSQIEGGSAMKISVIIPAYNAEQYIAKAIESCLNQTYAPHEIIVVDDGSTDSTAAVAESFTSQVRVIRLSENMGVPTARNRGVQASTGDWIAFLDADDWFLPEKLESQRRCALKHEHAVLIYTAFYTSLDGVESPARFNPPAALGPMLRYRCAFHVGTVALRRDAFDAVGGFDPSLLVCEDWDLWMNLAARYSVALFAAVPERVAVYRTTPGSISSNAMRMHTARTGLIAKRCLYGTAGMSRYLLRRRILAFLHYDTSVALREEGSPLDLPFILKSIAFWPLPWSETPKRIKVTAVMMKQHLFSYLSRSVPQMRGSRH